MQRTEHRTALLRRSIGGWRHFHRVPGMATVFVPCSYEGQLAIGPVDGARNLESAQRLAR